MENISVRSQWETFGEGHIFIGLKVLRAVTVKDAAFYDVTPYSLIEVYPSFRENALHPS
jgi:hypothetical protein